MELKPTKILTKRQLEFLTLFASGPLKEHFTLSGGTALCGFYIPYRYSEDLDFFSEAEFEIQSILIWLRSVQDQIGFRSYDLQTAFNRNLIFLTFPDEEVLKTEFTFYPFPSVQRNQYQDIFIDSLLDIAQNKLFTIYQQARLRDYMDLYSIASREKLNLAELRIKAKTKFDWDIDPIQLGSQLLKVSDRKDMPVLLESFNFDAMEKFFLTYAKELKADVFD